MEQKQSAADQWVLPMYDGFSEDQLLEEVAEAKRNGRLPAVSEQLDLRCRELIQKTFQQKRKEAASRAIRQFTRKAAVTLFAVLCIGSIMIGSVKAIRNPLFTALFGGDRGYATIIMESATASAQRPTESQRADARKESPLMGLIPQEYQIANLVYHGSDGLYCSYKNEAGETIAFWVKCSGGSFNFSTEDARVSKVKILNHDGVMVMKNQSHIYWMDASARLLFYFSTSAGSCFEAKQMAETVAQCPDWVTLIYGE